MNKSAVPLGSSVGIASGLRTNLGYLLDCNQATYSIASGEAWHLLFIKATCTANEATPSSWSFALLSQPVSDVNDLYVSGGQAPKFVDSNGQTVPYSSEEYDAVHPHFDSKRLPEGYTKLTSTGQVTGAPVMDAVNIWLNEWVNTGQVTWATEAGVHIYPIAYHRIIPGTPSTAEIVQCARSDYHFWPMPTLPVWSRKDEPVEIGVGLDTTIPGGGE